MIIMLPNKEEKKFYKSRKFEKILNVINNNPDFFYLKEKNNKLNIYVNKKINTIDLAKNIIFKFAKWNITLCFLFFFH